MSDNNPSLQNDSFEPASSSDSHRSGVEIFMPKGLSRFFPFVASRKLVRIDFDKGVISQGRIKIAFSRIKAIELRVGILGVTDGKRWICFDTLRFCDKSGSLSMHDGSLSPTFQLRYEIRRGIFRKRLLNSDMLSRSKWVPSLSVFLEYSYFSAITIPSWART